MHHINHFSHGLITPLLSYFMSVIGSLLGLMFTARAQSARGPARIRWLLGAALSIGGTGIWVMHFIAIMGFSITAAEVRFDVPLTALSAVTAIVVVGAGTLVVSRYGERTGRLLVSGLLTGLGVAGMHYLGMAAMNMTVTIRYNLLLVALSITIAVVASTVALWFTLRIKGMMPTIGAALVMGIASTGMHYTGMFAISVSGPGSARLPRGAEAIDFLVPLLVGISLVTIGMLMVVMLTPSEEEMRSDAELLARIEERRARYTATPAAPAQSEGRNGDSGAYGTPWNGAPGSVNGARNEARPGTRTGAQPAPPYGTRYGARHLAQHGALSDRPETQEAAGDRAWGQLYPPGADASGGHPTLFDPRSQ